MCHFITATLPRGADADAAVAVARRYGRVWVPLENPHVISQLRLGEGYFFTSSGHCDCGTVLGSLRTAEPSRPGPEKRIPKLRRKGWSEARIQRWLTEKRRAEASRAADSEARRSRHSPDAEVWESRLRDLLVELRVDFVGLLLHMYSGHLDSERIHIARKQPVASSALTPAFLLQVEEDVLYRFRR